MIAVLDEESTGLQFFLFFCIRKVGSMHNGAVV